MCVRARARMCVCVCVCARAHVSVCAYLSVCACVSVSVFVYVSVLSVYVSMSVSDCAPPPPFDLPRVCLPFHSVDLTQSVVGNRKRHSHLRKQVRFVPLPTLVSQKRRKKTFEWLLSYTGNTNDMAESDLQQCGLPSTHGPAI